MTVTRPPDPPTLPGRARRAIGWPAVRLLGGALVLALVIWRLGTGPFLDGIRSVDLTAAVAALAIGAVTTVCSAWRWQMVAGRLGVGLPLRSAVAAYYRSQFLNATLPGGVLGDVHRALRHGRETGDPSAGMRSVAWERIVGPVVHVGLTGLVLLTFPGPFTGGWVAPVLATVAVLALVVVCLRRPWAGRLGRWATAAAHDARVALLARSVWPGVLSASVVVAVGHALTFVIAARATGLAANPAQVLPVAMLVLAAMLVPLNVGGWGPRESVAAGLFAAAGWGAAQGVAAATAFGVLALIATLPGLPVLAAGPLLRSARSGGGPR